MAIKANIMSLEHGYEHLENLRAVRIISSHYNILIMDDYVPIIGEVQGTISFVNKEGTARELRNVHGFYRHSKNEFSFLMDD